MSGVKLWHTTSNYNKVLPGVSAGSDQDIGIRALWTSITAGTALEPCCKHHLRIVSLSPQLFADWVSDDDWAKWTLLYVAETHGQAPNHTFYKYVLCPSEKKEYLLKDCKNSGKYEHAFTVHTKHLFKELAKFQQKWFGTATTNEVSRHFHVGILGATPFDQYQDENYKEWKHLRPNLPKVHQTENDHSDSEESLTESEIFRKFAFENDGVEEVGWTSVRNKKVPKDGCLPFCFEANKNIFPDCEGVFRHYCRAEVNWVCKHKCQRSVGSAKVRGQGPTEAEEKEEKKGTPSAWTSHNSWYHVHLKDHEGQGLRKGFERQYCRTCWNKSHEWVEGKIAGFRKPVDKDRSGPRLPHDPEMCEMCQRLKTKGFDGTCGNFSECVNSGSIVVVEGEEGWKFVGKSESGNGNNSQKPRS